MTASLRPARRAARHSASIARWRRCRRRPAARAARPSESRTATPRSGRWLGPSATPVAGSTSHGMPKPTAAHRAGAASRELVAPPRRLVDHRAGVVRARRRRWRTSSVESTVPASSFVPPRSTPITQPAAMFGHHTRAHAAAPRRRREYKALPHAAAAVGRAGGDGRRSRSCASAPPAAGARRQARSRVGRVVKWLALALAAGWPVARPVPDQRPDQPGPGLSGRAGRAGRRRLRDRQAQTISSSAPTRARRAPRSRAPTRRAPAAATRSCSSAPAAATRQALDPARHGRRHPRPRPRQDQRRLRLRRRRARGQTIKQYLGIQINHVVEVNFANFPELIDAMGGDQLHGRLRRLADQRRLQQRRLHAAPEERARPHQRQAGARPRAHAQQPLQPDGERPHPRAPPAGDPHRDEVARRSARAFIRLPWIAWNAPKTIEPT